MRLALETNAVKTSVHYTLHLISTVHVKRMLYYQRSAFWGLEQYVSHDWCVIFQNMHHGHFLGRHFVRTFGNNLQTIGCTYRSDARYKSHAFIACDERVYC